MAGFEGKPLRDDVAAREAARNSLHEFVRQGWGAVEGAPFRDGWHIGAICEHLQAVSAGQIRRLLIIIPPQCSKSILSGTFWPAWEWLRKPEIRWLYASNSDELALEESMRCRRLVESEWYKLTFGVQWEMTPDQDTKGYYINTAGGSRRALGFNATFTGKKGNRVVIDDANDAEKVHSEAERRRVNRKYDNAISDRHLDLNNDPTVIIGQRTHYNDLIGHVRSQGGWEELHLREEFRPEKRTPWPVKVPIRGPDGVVREYDTDPRERHGELLRPKDLGRPRIAENRAKNLMTYQAKHQGDPRSAEGYRFKAAWFADRWRFAGDGQHIELHRGEDIYLVHPFGLLRMRERFGIVDPSASKKVTADYMVTSTFIITERFDLVWFGCRRQRAEIPEQPAILEGEYRRQRLSWVGIEAVYGNRALLQHAMKTRMVVRPLDPAGRDKLAHATPALILAETGRIWLPSPEAAMASGFPLAEVIDELTAFTGDDQVDEHDDVIDTLSYAVDHFSAVDTSGGVGGAAPVPIGAPDPNAWQQPPPINVAGRQPPAMPSVNTRNPLPPHMIPRRGVM